MSEQTKYAEAALCYCRVVAIAPCFTFCKKGMTGAALLFFTVAQNKKCTFSEWKAIFNAHQSSRIERKLPSEVLLGNSHDWGMTPKHRLGQSGLYPAVLKLCLGAGENLLFHRARVK